MVFDIKQKRRIQTLKNYKNMGFVQSNSSNFNILL